MKVLLRKIWQHSWPFSAIVFWLILWLVYYFITAINVSTIFALVATLTLASVLARMVKNRWRQFILIGGFVASWLINNPSSGLTQIPAWIWLLPFVALIVTYPIQTWADAPWFPTPGNALNGLGFRAPLKKGAKILDAGCGLGHGLHELRKQYPEAELVGIERSGLLARVCAWRCKWATIQTADIWKANWSAYDMVYLFQRPESMEKTAKKAKMELRPGAWLVSLEFEMEDCLPTDKIVFSHGKIVWLYQMPLQLK